MNAILMRILFGKIKQGDVEVDEITMELGPDPAGGGPNATCKVKVATTCKPTINGKPAELKDLQPGDKIRYGGFPVTDLAAFREEKAALAAEPKKVVEHKPAPVHETYAHAAKPADHASAHHEVKHPVHHAPAHPTHHGKK